MPFSSTNPPEDITKCPKCGKHAFFVLETRSNKEYTRRRRNCRECGFRTTFYEVSQERYEQFKADSKALHDLLDKLEGLLTNRGNEPKKVKAPKAKPSPCTKCEFGLGGSCSFEYPEAFTPEAHDCSIFIEVFENANSVK